MGDEMDIMTALQAMSDEELQQLLRASNAPNRSGFVEREMQRAAQIPGMGDYSTPGGAMFGGLAHILRSGTSAMKQHGLRGQFDQQMSLMEDPAAARNIMGAVDGTGSMKSKQQVLIDLLRKSGGAGDALAAGKMELGLAS